jgi:Protein of unknown function (DUF3097)
VRNEGRGGRGTYGPDVLSAGWRRPLPIPTVTLEHGLVVECADSGWCGAVTSWDKHAVELEDRSGSRRLFPLAPGAFLLEGRPVTLTRPASGPGAKRRTASGSLAVHGQRAQVARASRLWVEGIHDAELVEQVWGDDLRVEGVVVERLDGIDDLPEAVRAFGPGPGRRLGVLVDHLVPGSKESRLAAEAAHDGVLVLGHPYVDVWQAVRPSSLGIPAWPEIPRGVPWKEGVCAALGWGCATPAEMRAAWVRVRSAVHTYADLEPTFLRAVEELVDFVTA